jgi:hypothetical protein
VAPGRWRVSFDAAYGAFSTSHVAECPDVAPECATQLIPPHMHRAKVGVTHSELEAVYGLREQMQLALRLPYDVKDIRIRYTTLEGGPFTPPYGDIHHRTETLRGLGDPSLMLDWSPSPGWQLGFGTTFPAGDVTEDPVRLGKEGLKHEHTQFGTGTFNPKLAVQFYRARLFARAEGRLTAYESSGGYRAPNTFVLSVGPSLRAGRISIDPRINAQYQGRARWHGEADEGSGFHNGGLRLQLGVPVGSMTLAPGVYRELWSHGFDGQSFRQGTTWSLAVSRGF